MKVNPTEILNYLKSRGVSDNHAWGMVNNIRYEGDFDPGAREKGVAQQTGNVTKGGIGLFQHTGVRREALKQAVPDWETNWKGQIDFALSEPSSSVYLGRDFSNPIAASKWFTEHWEAPAHAATKAVTRARGLPDLMSGAYTAGDNAVGKPQDVLPGDGAIAQEASKAQDIFAPQSDIEKSLSAKYGGPQPYTATTGNSAASSDLAPQTDVERNLATKYAQPISVSTAPVAPATPEQPTVPGATSATSFLGGLESVPENIGSFLDKNLLGGNLAKVGRGVTDFTDQINNALFNSSLAKTRYNKETGSFEQNPNAAVTDTASARQGFNQTQAAAAEQHPVANLAGQITGALGLGTVAAAPIAGIEAPSAVGMAAKTLLGLGTEGAVAEAGMNPDATPQSLAESGAISMGTGVALKGLGAGIKKLSNVMTDIAIGKVGVGKTINEIAGPSLSKKSVVNKLQSFVTETEQALDTLLSQHADKAVDVSKSITPEQVIKLARKAASDFDNETADALRQIASKMKTGAPIAPHEANALKRFIWSEAFGAEKIKESAKAKSLFKMGSEIKSSIETAVDGAPGVKNSVVARLNSAMGDALQGKKAVVRSVGSLYQKGRILSEISTVLGLGPAGLGKVAAERLATSAPATTSLYQAGKALTNPVAAKLLGPLAGVSGSKLTRGNK